MSLSNHIINKYRHRHKKINLYTFVIKNQVTAPIQTDTKFKYKVRKWLREINGEESLSSNLKVKNGQIKCGDPLLKTASVLLTLL